MIEFIDQYGIMILCALSIILELILLVFKKRPKTFDDFVSILCEVSLSLPSMISSVEVVGHGFEKKVSVIAESEKLVQKKLGRSLSEKEVKIFNDFISSQIELILSTPQKKEIK